MTSVWWVRRDARLRDNAALLEAQDGHRAAAVFAWNPAIESWSGRRRAHLARGLTSLHHDTGGALTVRAGDTADTVAAAAREADAPVVWAAREYSPAGVSEQEAVAASLGADGRELRLIGSPYAVAPGRLFTGGGRPFQVFTPFRSAWQVHGWRGPAPAARPELFSLLDGAPAVDLAEQAASGDAEDPLTVTADASERAAHERLADFLEVMSSYARDRDRPAAGGTSGLSVALAYGHLHPRTVLDAVMRATPAGAGDGSAAFVSELAWRDFHADVLHHYPHALRRSLKPVMADDAWATGDAADRLFAAWCAGQTGYPLVDAGMRELAATGIMHNRVRMVVASFLVKDLHLPWQRGADHFRRMLLDYDHAQNQLNWQWVAGTGRDAAPFFRVFNPATQAATHDPHGTYVRAWVPEWGTPAYPEPIVDHARERQIALDHHRRAMAARRAESPAST